MSSNNHISYEIRSWGANSYGQLCTCDEEDRLTPTTVKLPHAEDIIQICGGGGHTLFLLRDGSVLACGSNSRGQLGRAEPAFSSQALSVPLTEPVKRLAAGWEASFAVTATGHLYAWGSNSHGQLGLDTSQPSVYAPTQVNVDECVVDIAAGARHSLAVTTNGRVFTWGWNKKGQLGGSTATVCLRPIKLQEISSAVQCAAGDHHSAVLLADKSTVLAWGDNRYGQCGPDSDASSCSSPVVVKVQGHGSAISRLISGWTHLSVLLDSGQVITWGRNAYQQLGRTTNNTFCRQPTLVPTLRLSQLACGSQHSLGASETDVVAWGWNEHGICCVPIEGDVPTPTPVQNALPDGYRLVLLGCGAGTSFVLSCRTQSCDDNS